MCVYSHALATSGYVAPSADWQQLSYLPRSDMLPDAASRSYIDQGIRIVHGGSSENIKIKKI